MKRIGTLLLVVILTLCCLSLNSYGKEEVTLKIVIGSWLVDAFKPHLLAFEEETGIKVEYDSYPFRDLLETIEIRQEAKDTEVDLILVDAPLTASYALRGMIKPLDPYFTQEEIRETWHDTTADAGYWDDNFWSAPLNNSGQILYYNKDLLMEAGIEFPSIEIDERWTWEEIVEAAKLIRNPQEGIWGFSFRQINRYYQIQVLPESIGGGSGVNETGNRAVLTNKEWIEAFTFYHKLFEEWDISPRGFTPLETAEQFQAGKIGFMVGDLFFINNFVKSGINFGVAPHPYFSQGKPATPTHSFHMSIWAHTQQEEKAAQLLKYLTVDPELNQHWFEEIGYFPAHRKVLAFINESPLYAIPPHIGYRIVVYETENTAITRAQTPAFLEFEEITHDVFEDIRNGLDPVQALTEAEERINRAMRRYRF